MELMTPVSRVRHAEVELRRLVSDVDDLQNIVATMLAGADDRKKFELFLLYLHDEDFRLLGKLPFLGKVQYLLNRYDQYANGGLDGA